MMRFAYGAPYTILPLLEIFSGIHSFSGNYFPRWLKITLTSLFL